MIGEFARTPRFQGAGSSQVTPTKVENALDELTAAFGEVTFAAGYGIGDTSADAALRAEAVEVAAAADTVVMLIGLPGADESEGFDRTHMRCPPTRSPPCTRSRRPTRNVVVVLVNGSTVELGEVVPHARGARRGVARRAGRRGCDRGRAVRRGQPVRAGSPRRSRTGSRTTPRT